jgi:hypothetical protein
VEKDSLIELFDRLGAKNPEAWASSQLREGIPQLARFLFLRQAWSLVLSPSDQSWREELKLHNISAEDDVVVSAVERVLASGARQEDVAAIVREMQARLLFSFCYLLSDPGELEPEVEDVAWRLFTISANGEPLQAITGLHESVLNTQPK